MNEDESLKEMHHEEQLRDSLIQSTDNHKKTQLDRVIDQMFQNESDRIINDEEIDSGYGKVIITIIAIMMSVVILLSFLYRFL